MTDQAGDEIIKVEQAATTRATEMDSTMGGATTDTSLRVIDSAQRAIHSGVEPNKVREAIDYGNRQGKVISTLGDNLSKKSGE